MKNCLDFVFQIPEWLAVLQIYKPAILHLLPFTATRISNFFHPSCQRFNSCLSIVVTFKMKVMFLTFNYICNLQERPPNAAKPINLHSCEIFLELSLPLFVNLCFLSTRVVINGSILE